MVLGVNELVLKAIGIKRENYRWRKHVYDLYPIEMAERIIQHNDRSHSNSGKIIVSGRND